jgi:hypothetical protein
MVPKGKTAQQEYYYKQSYPLDMKGEIRTFPDKQKLTEFITTRLVLQEMIREVLQTERDTNEQEENIRKCEKQKKKRMCGAHWQE